MIAIEVLETTDPILQQDIAHILSTLDLSSFYDCAILITGATGLIGSQIAMTLACCNRLNSGGMRLVLAVRDMHRAKERLGELWNREDVFMVCADIAELAEIPVPVDYVIHCAAETSSLAFVKHPIQTISSTVMGTKNLLDLLVAHPVKAMVYLSSMEVYGFPLRGQKVTEASIGAFSPLKIRNSYPIGKITAEALCVSYAEELGFPVKIARLTQTFGPCVDYADKRVFAEFVRSAIDGRPIVLNTEGKTERSYLYTADAVSGIFTVLLRGKSGQAYNLANEGTYCSISEMAGLVAKLFPGTTIEYRSTDAGRFGYADTLYMNLDTEAAQNLGWNPSVPLDEMYMRMAASMQARIGSNTDPLETALSD